MQQYFSYKMSVIFIGRWSKREYSEKTNDIPRLELIIPPRGGSRISSNGGAHLKKSCRVEGGVKIFGVFRVKNHDFTQKNHIFSNFRGGGHVPGAPPPGSAPATVKESNSRTVVVTGTNYTGRY